MNPRSLEFQIIETLTNIRRNALMALAAMTNMAACLFFLGVFALVMWNVHAATRQSAEGVRIVVYLNRGTEVAQAEELAQSLRAKHASLVREMRVLGASEVLHEAERWGAPIEGYESENNPFGPVIEIALTDPSHWQELVATARGDQRVDDVRSGGVILDALASFQRMGRVGGATLVVLLSFASLLTISNTIRLTIYARRREIRIMQIVGATPGFIRAPFLFEGILQGIVGGLVATGVLLPLYWLLGDWVTSNLPAFGKWFVSGSRELTCIFGGLITIGVVFGALGSWISVRRYLE